jgi:hypothetical protein
MVEPPLGNGSTTSTSPNVYFLSTYVFYITSTFDYYGTVFFLSYVKIVVTYWAYAGCISFKINKI